jgi:hypothetical protein
MGTEESARTAPSEASAQRVRELCLALPAVEERLSHGEPTWFVGGKKTFVMFADRHHDDRVGIWCAAGPGVQESLVARRPAQFFRPPYVGHRGWLGIYLDVPVDWGEVADLVDDAFRMVAPKRLIAELDQR